MTSSEADNAKTILLVDDESGVLSSLKRLLHPLPYRIRTAGNGMEALLVARETRPDMIILDVCMPQMDGFEVLRRLREDGLGKIPVVMLTGAKSSEQLLKGYTEGAVYYITKPFKNEHLLNIINYLIGDLSRAEREEMEKRL